MNDIDPASIPRRNASRRWQVRLIVVTTAFLFAFAIGEAALRLTGRFPDPPHPIICEAPHLFEASEQLGYRLYPSRTTSDEYPIGSGRMQAIHSNRDGFRSQREFDEEDPRLRILVVGDSFVYGLGVEHDERFTNKLEELRPEWRVDSLGLPGFGIDLMLRSFREIGPRAQPDVVVLCVYTDDFGRVRPHYAGVGFEIPRMTLRNNQLESRPYPKRRWYDSLHVVQGARRAQWKFSNGELKLNEAILDAFREAVEQAHAMLAITFLPARADSSIDRKRRTWLAQYASDHKIPFVDLTEAIHSRKISDLFIKHNWHLNNDGNRVVAEQLARFLDDQVVREAQR